MSNIASDSGIGWEIVTGDPNRVVDNEMRIGLNQASDPFSLALLKERNLLGTWIGTPAEVAYQSGGVLQPGQTLYIPPGETQPVVWIPPTSYNPQYIDPVWVPVIPPEEFTPVIPVIPVTPGTSGPPVIIPVTPGTSGPPVTPLLPGFTMPNNIPEKIDLMLVLLLKIGGYIR